MEETKSRYTVEDIRQSYDADKAVEERYTEWAVYYVYRPLSFQITPFFLHLSFSPSNVTFISLVLAISLPFMALWLPAPFFFVGLMGLIISVLDCVDGNIARVTGQTSRAGGYFDFLTDILYRVLMYLSIGLIVSQSSWIPESYTNIAAACMLIAVLLAIIARMCRMHAEGDLSSKEETQIDKKNGHESSNWLDKYFFPFFSGLDWALPFAVIILGYTGQLHWVLVWLLLYSALDFIHTQYSIFSKL